MTTRYLSPKIDLVFRKIFGQHPNILMSFLNATLPLPEGRYITELTYLPADEVPAIPSFKHTIADVKCKDQTGDIFIVEMQIQWTASFAKRLLYGASRAYVHQLRRGEPYRGLNRVLGVGLIDAVFDETSDEWYHHYRFKHETDATKSLDDVQLLFIELPKFQPQSLTDKKMQVLWLRFISELNEETREVPQEWLEVPEIQEALTLAQEAAYTPEELASYETYWDSVSTQKSYVHDAEKKGIEEGMAKGIEKGREEGMVKGIEKGKLEVAKNLLAQGLDINMVSKATYLSVDKIERLAKKS